MRKIKFSKLTGAGNDFIVIDNRENIIGNRKKLALEVCDRKMSLGADGLILIETSKVSDLKMRIFNSDGSEAAMCGNGIRCFGLFAYLKKICGSKMTVETAAGVKYLEVSGRDYVKVNMGKPLDLRLNIKIPVDGHIYRGYFINTGVPHVIVYADKPDIKELGRKIRFHKLFSPKGANVNFVKVLGKKSIKVRTYERGVEDETLACGTGATASACISNIIKGTRFPVTVETSGGELLVIDVDKENNLLMSGKVKYICEGIFK